MAKSFSLLSDLLAELDRLPGEKIINLQFCRSYTRLVFVDQDNFSAVGPSQGALSEGPLPEHGVIILEQTTCPQNYSTVAILKKTLVPGNPNAVLAMFGEKGTLLPLSLPLSECLSMVSIAGLFRETTLGNNLTESWLCSEMRKLQLDFDSAAKYVAQTETSAYPPGVAIWHVQSEWYTSAALDKAFPWLVKNSGWKDLFSSDKSAVLRQWNAKIPFQEARKQLSLLHEAKPLQENKPRDAASILLARYGPAVPAEAPVVAGEQKAAVSAAEKVPSATAVVAAPIGICVADFLKQLKQHPSSATTNVSLTTGIRFYKSQCYDGLQIDRGFQKPDDDWNAVVLTVGGTASKVSELIAALSSVAEKQPWAIVAGTFQRSEHDVRLLKCGDYTLTAFAAGSFASSPLNPFANGGSVYETCTTSKMSPETFNSLYPTLGCYVVDGVFYSPTAFHKMFDISTGDIDKLFNRNPSSSDVRVLLPGIPHKEFLEHFGKPLSAVQKLLHQYAS